ncbi:hypothetical protein PPNSA23_34910 [Phyllobacterium phragmitis]|uniref:Uncharacterized protein n=1 Tax=Phyllobacterium phragmitis TaxID=2670329 RepID=A0ABQ0H3R4_9HYPH
MPDRLEPAADRLSHILGIFDKKNAHFDAFARKMAAIKKKHTEAAAGFRDSMVTGFPSMNAAACLREKDRTAARRKSRNSPRYGGEELLWGNSAHEPTHRDRMRCEGLHAVVMKSCIRVGR